MLTFIVINSAWWWLLTFAFLMFVIWGGVKEDGWMLGIDILAYLFLLHFIVNVSVFQAVYHNPAKSLLFFIGYFVIGTGWSFFKWYLRVRKYVNHVLEHKKIFLRDKEVDGDKIPANLVKAWKEHRFWPHTTKPIAKESMDDISFWITYWPISVGKFLLKDFISTLVQGIINRFGGLYKFIENTMYKKLD